MSDYDIDLLRCDYLSGHLTATEFEQKVGDVLNGLRLHECEWVDVTAFGETVATVVCAKCGTKRQHTEIA